MMNRDKITGIVLGIAIAAVLAGCGADAQATPESNSGVSEESTSTGDAVNIPNPFTEVESLDEAAKITGFTLNVPDAPEDYPDMSIRVMDDSLIEVIYSRENETGEGTEEAYRIRKAEGSEDISGDYNEYKESVTVQTGVFEVTLKGDGDAWSVATWQSGGFSYAVDCQEHPMPEEELTEIIAQIE